MVEVIIETISALFKKEKQVHLFTFLDKPAKIKIEMLLK